jgi:hypothetical protein
MAVCDLCKGTGRLLKPWYDTTGLMTGFTGDICFKCDGKGTIGEPMPNEEWLRSATFEEIAGAIYEWYTLGYTRGKNGKKLNSITEVVEWLKEKHDGNI